MCEPMSIMAAASVAGTAVSMGGQIMGGMAAQKQGKLDQAHYDRQAKLEEEAAESNANSHERAARRTMGRRDNIIAASGLSGGNSDIRADDQKEAALEGEIIKHGGKAKAFNLRYQGAAAKARGDNALTGSIFGAVGTGLNAVASFPGVGTNKFSSGSSGWQTSVSYG